MARVRLLATGGTIASRRGARGRTASVTAAELLAAVPGLPDELEVLVRDVGATLSFAMQLPDLQDLAVAVEQALEDPETDGVVITHGTDSMEETAFFLDLLQGDPRPVILTGAQRPFDSASPDGPGNLGTALRTAASPVARSCGVLLLFDGIAWPAHGVQKADTLASAGFGAPGRGPVLRVTDDRIHLLATPHRPSSPFTADAVHIPLPRVDILPTYLGVDATQIEAARAAGARGLVVAAFGAGNTPPSMTNALVSAIDDGIPVLICSRVPAGPVEALYGGGGGSDLRRAGAMFGADLTPAQGRLLLARALVAPGRPETILRDWLS